MSCWPRLDALAAPRAGGLGPAPGRPRLAPAPRGRRDPGRRLRRVVGRATHCWRWGSSRASWGASPSGRATTGTRTSASRWPRCAGTCPRTPRCTSTCAPRPPPVGSWPARAGPSTPNRGWRCTPTSPGGGRPWISTGAQVVEAADAVPDRVAVQRSGFEGSTFTEEAWARLADGPGYRRDLDLVLVGDGVPAVDRHRVVGRRGRDRHPRARGVPPRPSRPRLGRPRGHRPRHAPAGPRRLGSHGVHAARLRRRDRDLPRRRAARGRAPAVTGPSGRPRRPRRPATRRARAPAPRGGWTACRAAAPSGRAGRHRPPRRRGRR